MSVKAPHCKLCGAAHWTTEPHVFEKPAKSIPAKFQVGDVVGGAGQAESTPRVGVTQPAPPATSVTNRDKPKGGRPPSKEPSPEALRQRKRRQRQSQARSAIPKAIRDFVHERSQGVCEESGCFNPAEHIHHEGEAQKGMGGSSAPDRDDPAKLIHLCRHHHDLAHGVGNA